MKSKKVTINLALKPRLLHPPKEEQNHLLNGSSISFLCVLDPPNRHISNSVSNRSSHRVGHRQIVPPFPVLHQTNIINNCKFTIKSPQKFQLFFANVSVLASKGLVLMCDEIFWLRLEIGCSGRERRPPWALGLLLAATCENEAVDTSPSIPSLASNQSSASPTSESEDHSSSSSSSSSTSSCSSSSSIFAGGKEIGSSSAILFRYLEAKIESSVLQEFPRGEEKNDKSGHKNPKSCSCPWLGCVWRWTRPDK